MGEEAWRFIDHQHPIVFVQDGRQRGGRTFRSDAGQEQMENLTRPNSRRGAQGSILVIPHQTPLNAFEEPGPRPIPEASRQEAVETHPVGLFGHGEDS